MQKAFLFFLAVAIILLLAYAKPVEGFTSIMGMQITDVNAGTPPALYTKLPVKQPNVVSLAEAGVGNIQPSPPSAGTLPSAPVEQRSKETPNPYRDPSMEPAKYIRILSVKEDLQAFFGFQAFMLEDRNDPAIQMPLTRARADMAELIDVQSVMERNPGLQSRITNKQLDDIQSNLRYLRAILRDLEASGAIQPQALESFTGMEDQEEEAVEGFQSPPKRIKPRKFVRKPAVAAAAVAASAATNVKEVASQPKAAPEPTTFDPSGKRATLKQLQEFQTKVVVEITRLNASGTNDPVIVGRITTLNRIKDDVDQVIDQLQRGVITPKTVPIYSADIERALPLLGRANAPLPTLLKKTGLPPAVQNLFPGGLSPRDTEQANQINNIVQGYMKNIFEGTSWGLNVNVNYDNPNILKLKAAANAPSDGLPVTGLPGVKATASKPGMKIERKVNGVAVKAKVETPATSSEDRGFDGGLPGLATSRTLPTPKSGKLDWKQRSQEIKEQVRKRGLNPMNFGALPDDAVVSDSFSWRGYAQMMCARLNTTMDPGLATTVGCPSQSWSGWRD
jgi:hypothetical protein